MRRLVARLDVVGVLRIKSALDRGSYDQGVKVPKEQFDGIDLRPDRFHGDWNYAISPRARRQRK